MTATPQAQYELPAGTGNNPQEDYNKNWTAADKAGGWVTAEIAIGEGGSEGEWYTFDGTGKAKKAQADTLDNCAVTFILTQDTAEGLQGKFLKAGNWYKSSWGGDPSKIYYLDQSTPGAWTTTQPASGLIIVLGRFDQDTETFHIAEGGGGGGGGLNDHATLTNLAWSVAGHTMDATLAMNLNSITGIDYITMQPQGGTGAPGDVIQILNGSYTANPSQSYYGVFQNIVKSGGATTTAWHLGGRYTELDHADAVNTIGRLFGDHNILEVSEDMGNNSDALWGSFHDIVIDAGKTLTGRVKGNYVRFHPEGEVTLQTYGTINWIGPSSGGTLNNVWGSYQNIICAALGTINGNAYGHYSDMGISGANRLTGNEYGYFAKSSSTGVTGLSYAYYAEGTPWDYFLYCGETGAESYLAGVLQVDNTIWSEGTVGATPTSGAGTRFMWIPSKRAIRAGEVDSTQWDDANIGQGSFVFSRHRSSASGADTFVTGWNCSASGQYGVAMGYFASATGSASIALGSTVTANAFNAVAIGKNITAGTSAKCFGESITSFTDGTMIGYNLTTNTCYRAVYVGRNITGGSGTNNDCYAFGQFIEFITGDDNWVIGKGVDAGNPLMSVGADKLAIGMHSNLPSIVLDGSSAGIGTRADVIIYGALTLNDDVDITGDVHIIGEFYVTPPGTGINSEAYGQGAASTGDNSIVLGYQVTSAGSKNAIFGSQIAVAGHNQVHALGHNISGIGGQTVAIGADINVTATATASVFIGSVITAPTTAPTNSVVIGYQAIGDAADIVAIGEDVSVTGARSVGIGHDLICSGLDAVVLGKNANCNSGNSVGLGADVIVNGAQAVAIGKSSVAGLYSVAIGNSASAVSTSRIAIGPSAVCSHDESIALGRNAVTTQVNELAIGATSYEIDHITFVVSGNEVVWHNLVSFQPSTAGANSEVIGAGSQGVTGADTVALGKDIIASGGNSVYIGHNIQPSGGTAANSVLIGADVDLNFDTSVIIGFAASANQTSCVIGYQAVGGTEAVVMGNDANGGSGVCIGVRAVGSGVTIGTDTVGHSSCTIVGEDATRNGNTDVICIGRGATATASNQMMIGAATYEIDDLTFIVSGTYLTWNNSVTIVGNVSARPSGTGANSEAFGEDAAATGSFAVALGDDSVASNTAAIAIGQSADATGVASIAIGNNAQATTNGTVIGRNADDNANSDCTIVGNGATANGKDSVVIGKGATNGSFGVVIGSGATSTGLHAISIGLNTTAALDSIAIGRDAAATGTESIALGRGATASVANSMVVGSVGYEIDNLTFTVSGVSLAVSTIFDFNNGLHITGNNALNFDGATGNQKIISPTGLGKLEFYGGGSGGLAFTIATDLGVLGNKVTYAYDIEMQAATILGVLGTVEFGVQGTGAGRIKWHEYEANSVTLNNGTTSSVVADLRTANDGNVYHINEAATTPGIQLIVDFTSVTEFQWIKINATYDGSATHNVDVEVYNWITTSWDKFDCMQDGFSNSGASFEDHSFFIEDPTNYVGTGGSAGQVRVRFNHAVSGNAAHDLYIDQCSLYQ